MKRKIKNIVNIASKMLFLGVIFICLGCSSTKKVVDNTTTEIQEKIIQVTKDSLVYIHDTTTITNVIKEVEQITEVNDSGLQEWWDNWTKTFIDTTGTIVIETHQTGNRNEHQTNSRSQLKTLQDSISFLSGEYNYYKNAYDSLNSISNEETTHQYSSDTTINKTNWYKHFFWTLVGILVLIVVIYCIIKIIKKQNGK